jgi:membrane protease YdiL (CAAX protease family)
MLKGVLKNYNGFIQVIMLIALLFAGYLIGQIIFGMCFSAQLPTQSKDVGVILESLYSSPDLLRLGLFINHICTFLFPAVFAAYIFSDSYRDYLHIETPFSGATAFWTAVSMLVALPALNFVADLNQQMTLPAALHPVEEVLKALEEQNARALEVVLNTDRTGTFIVNVLIVAVLAAVGEEFVFRGVLQNIFGKTIINHHIVIWAVAIIFSAIHLQFYGFLPRMLLGAYFGYLLYFTKSLWIPVLAHFINNFAAVAATWYFRYDQRGTEALDSCGTGDTWWMAAASAAVFIFCIGRITKSVRPSNSQ